LELPPEYSEKKWIDSSVYSKTQQFRTLGSTKSKTDRHKQLVLKWRFQESLIEHSRQIETEPELQFLEDFGNSIVTAPSKSCKLLPSFISAEECRSTYSSDCQISNDLAWEAICLLAEKAGVTPDHPKFPYRFKEIEGSLILLKRVRPSRCRVCNRIHEHENPYLLYLPETGNVYFDCRRSVGGEKMLVGCLKPEEESSSDSEKVESPDSPDSPQARNWCLDKIQQLTRSRSEKTKKKIPDEASERQLMKKIRSQI
jgi:hypothetical protein